MAGLLVLVAVGWLAWKDWETRKKWGFSAVMGALAGMSLLFLFLSPIGWLAVAYQTTMLVALSCAFWRNRKHPWMLIPILALSASAIYQLIPALYESLGLAGPSPLNLAWFNLGEGLVVLSGIVFGWVLGRGATRRDWTLAALPAIGFTGMFLSVPAMVGIFSIWSVGLTLYLPWPLYAMSIWAMGVAIMKGFREKNEYVWGLLLLPAGGYASQLSTLVFYSLLAVWILTLILNEADLPKKERAPIRKPAKIQTNVHAQ